jgi:2-oxoisovalerate dehydrogenase E1 component
MAQTKKAGASKAAYKKEVLEDYKLAQVSRNLSVVGRKEVLTGKAKFGIFGDGKEVAQIALAKQFRDGDWRSGYYRDQTWMIKAGLFSPEEFFYQLYGETNVELSPSNGGRSFNNHFGSRSIDEKGDWKDLTKQPNTSADISPTAGQMPRLLGLAWASKLYRNNPELHQYNTLSNKGNEVAFGSIGDASTSEGHFWETINAAGVLQVPMAISVWDDGYGISVPAKYQTTKQNISAILKGFETDENGQGYYIYKAKGWDYPALVEMYREGIEKCRKEHVPVLFHVDQVTQPQGHSTSGSHERYKSDERLQFEKDFDPLVKMRAWIIDSGVATAAECDTVEKEAANRVKEARKKAWNTFKEPIVKERENLLQIIEERTCKCKREGIDKVGMVAADLKKVLSPIRRDNFSAAKKILRHVCLDCNIRKDLQSSLSEWLKRNYEDNRVRYNTHLHVEDDTSALKVKSVKPEYTTDSPMVNGREILRDNYDYIFANNPKVLVFGEDAGNIGGVNQSLEGIQKKYGEVRISDTGIRETTIMGQGIGLALRGLRPIAEIQYLDYLLYALQTMSDDLACTLYRTVGGQKVPLIISTRGHRLEGIWHSGSPVSMVINSVRGVYVCTPRNMTQAAGFYNTLLDGQDPAMVIEPLNGYRIKERRPDNVGEYKIPLGVPEVMTDGNDVTLVTYGSCVKIAEEAVEQLKEFNISVELIDVQTLLPFDTKHMIQDSIKKTGRVLFFDEDVPGGTTGYMMQKVLEEQNAFYYLDSEPRTLTGKDHRPAYATDGDYFSNPNAEDVFETIYGMMHESDPIKFPILY